MKTINILIVEDDADIINLYKRDIESYNRTQSDFKIFYEIKSDKDEVISILKNSEINFDGAIVDLDLKNSGGNDSSGNEVIQVIKSNLRFPVFVISGTSHNLDESLNEETSFFKVRNRDDNEFDYINEFVNIYNTGIVEIINRKGILENHINDIFWKHLSNSLELWVNDDTRTSEEKQKSLIRYTILHLQEYLDEEVEKYHPSEFYITAPIKENIFTGDIVTYNEKRYIILTPSCDIVLREENKRNTDKILLVEIYNLSEKVKGFDNLTKTTSDKNPNKDRLIRFINNNSKQNFHFIPKSNGLDAGLIDFQSKITVDEKEIGKMIESGNIERKATVSHPFLKDIISRYSNYYARQGSPDFDSDEIYNTLF